MIIQTNYDIGDEVYFIAKTKPLETKVFKGAVGGVIAEFFKNCGSIRFVIVSKEYSATRPFKTTEDNIFRTIQEAYAEAYKRNHA